MNLPAGVFRQAVSISAGAFSFQRVAAINVRRWPASTRPGATKAAFPPEEGLFLADRSCGEEPFEKLYRLAI